MDFRLPKILLDNDLRVHDAIAAEQAALFGPDANLYVMDVAARDALFDESSGNDTFLTGVFYFSGVWATDPDTTNDAAEGGLTSRQDCEIRIPRVSIETVGAPVPKQGDVIECWPNTASIDSARNSKFKFKGFFDIQKVSAEGEVGNSRTPVRYVLTCLRRSEFRPEVRAGTL